MRKTFFFIIVIASLLYSESCRKDDVCSACGVENPQENLAWLNTWLQSCMCEDIYQYFFDEKEYIIIESCPYGSDPSKEVFNCNGNLLCYQGGFGGDCPLSNAFWESYEERKTLIFVHRYY